MILLSRRLNVLCPFAMFVHLFEACPLEKAPPPTPVRALGHDFAQLLSRLVFPPGPVPFWMASVDLAFFSQPQSEIRTYTMKASLLGFSILGFPMPC